MKKTISLTTWKKIVKIVDNIQLALHAKRKILKATNPSPRCLKL